MLQRSGPVDSLERVTKTLAFDGNANLGAVGVVPLFTTTGEVWIISIVPFCTEDLTEGGATATIVLGVVGDTNLFIGSLNAVDIDANEFWVDTTPVGNGIALPSALMDVVITDNIVATVASQTVNNGTIRFDVYWRPLSDGATLIAA